MTLSEYMAEHGINRADMASRLNVSSEAIRLWLAGERMPTRDNLVAIIEATDGAVMPNDFVPSPSRQAEEAAS